MVLQFHGQVDIGQGLESRDHAVDSTHKEPEKQARKELQKELQLGSDRADIVEDTAESNQGAAYDVMLKDAETNRHNAVLKAIRDNMPWKTAVGLGR